MKFLPFIMLLLFWQSSAGQDAKDTTVSKWTLDSLRFELWQKTRTINQMRWAYNLKVNTVKRDSTFIKEDSLIVSYWSKDKRLIAQDIIGFADPKFHKNCKIATQNKFFDESGRLVFIEYWDNYCYDSTDVEEDVKRFDAKLAKEERLKYDTLGRLILRTTYEFQSFREGITFKTVYSYGTDNSQHQKTERISHYDFWK